MSLKDASMVTTSTEPAAAKAAENPTLSQPTTAQSRIHWAHSPLSDEQMADLEAKFEAARSRNWITDRMVEQYQHHWHCSREVALERLLAKAGA